MCLHGCSIHVIVILKIKLLQQPSTILTSLRVNLLDYDSLCNIYFWATTEIIALLKLK